MASRRNKSKRTELAPPPREVPASIRYRLLLGAFGAQIGWGMLGAGLILVWIFFPIGDVAWFLHAIGGTETVQGRVIDSEEMDAYVGEGTVYVIGFAYTVPEYGEYEGESFRVGSGMDEGDAVTIEYAARRRSVSKIQGTSRSIFGVWGSFPIVVPAFGAVLVGFRLRKGQAIIRLLARGKAADATLESKKRTEWTVNDQHVYKFTFGFTTDDGSQHTHEVKTLEVRRLTDDAKERLLYDPLRPARAVMFDAIPWNPSVDEAGHIQRAGVGGTIAVLAIPLLTLIGHGTYVFFQYVAPSGW